MLHTVSTDFARTLLRLGWERRRSGTRADVEVFMLSVFLENSAVMLDVVGRSLWEDGKGERRRVADAPERFHRGLCRASMYRDA